MPKITKCDHPCEEYFEYGDCPCTGLIVTPPWPRHARRDQRPQHAPERVPICVGCNRPFLYCPCKALDHPVIYSGDPGYESAWAMWQEECRLAGGAANIDFQNPLINRWDRP